MPRFLGKWNHSYLDISPYLYMRILDAKIFWNLYPMQKPCNIHAYSVIIHATKPRLRKSRICMVMHGYAWILRITTWVPRCRRAPESNMPLPPPPPEHPLASCNSESASGSIKSALWPPLRSPSPGCSCRPPTFLSFLPTIIVRPVVAWLLLFYDNCPMIRANDFHQTIQVFAHAAGKSEQCRHATVEFNDHFSWLRSVISRTAACGRRTASSAAGHSARPLPPAVIQRGGGGYYFKIAWSSGYLWLVMKIRSVIFSSGATWGRALLPIN